MRKSRERLVVLFFALGLICLIRPSGYVYSGEFEKDDFIGDAGGGADFDTDPDATFAVEPNRGELLDPDTFIPEGAGGMAFKVEPTREEFIDPETSYTNSAKGTTFKVEPANRGELLDPDTFIPEGAGGMAFKVEPTRKDFDGFAVDPYEPYAEGGGADFGPLSVINEANYARLRDSGATEQELKEYSKMAERADNEAALTEAFKKIDKERFDRQTIPAFARPRKSLLSRILDF